MAENVIFEGKLNGGSDDEFADIKKSVAQDLNSQRAAADIAKSLAQDYIILLTIACCKAVFGAMSNKKEVVDGLYDLWKERTGINLSAETKMFQDALFNAMNAESNISQDMTAKMNEQLQKFCATRDSAKELAEEAVKSIMTTILTENTEEETKNETESK